MLNEAFMFLKSVAYGALLLCSYDMIRAFRATWRQKSFWIAVGDLSFWLVWGILLFSRVYKWNNGVLR